MDRKIPAEFADLSQRRQIWGRRQARPLKDTQRQAMDDLWSTVGLNIDEDCLIHPQNLFLAPQEDLWLEIGFGGGEHLAAQASSHRNIGFIGVEPFVNGVASLMVHIQDQSLTNVRIAKDDARLLVARLPDQSVGRIFVLFPDPWPKKRHHKRRIIQDAMIQDFVRILKPGGFLHMATDHEDYGLWMQEVMARNRDFILDLQGRKSIQERPQDWHQTRYEHKAAQVGRGSIYLVYQLHRDEASASCLPES